jgi:hypothetical protein
MEIKSDPLYEAEEYPFSLAKSSCRERLAEAEQMSFDNEVANAPSAQPSRVPSANHGKFARNDSRFSNRTTRIHRAGAIHDE